MALPFILGLQDTARAECGLQTPDYAATRTITVGGNAATVRVNVAGPNTREETDFGNGVRITVRTPGRRVVFDPRARTGIALPTPRGPNLPTRSFDEAGRDGRRVRIQQVESRGRWLETSRATCRADGIMLDQTFVSIDARGQEVAGQVAQSDIRVGSQPAALFEVPPDVRVTSPGFTAAPPR